MKKIIQDFSSFRPSERPAIGEKVTIISTQRELKMMEWRREQYARLKNALDELGYEPYDYFHQEHGMSHSDVEKLETGEDGLDFYLDDDECEKIGAGREWILYGDERSKEHPCGRQMKEYLNEHPERREIVRKWMREDGCTVYNWSPDEYEEEDDYMSEFDEDDWE